ncbi:gliding motility-associated protein GldE [Bacteroidota bacterium]
MIVWILIILFLLVASGLVSGSEVAFFSLTPTNIRTINERNSARDNLIIKLLSKPEKLLATILIANNFINIGIVIISTLIYSEVELFNETPAVRFIFQVIIITFLILLFGEVIPKVYAARFSLRFVLYMVYLVFILNKIFNPISSLLANITLLYNNKFFQKKNNLSMDELSEALDLASPELSEDDKILHGIVRFGNIDVKEIMKARVDVIAVNIKTEFKELLKYIVDSGYSRMPVFSRSFDHIHGILYLKDMLPHFQKNNFRWQSLIRPPYFVPETKKINDLLAEFQTKKIHMAIVIDEYGGTSGIVTLEDVLEEIVGEIQEETDRDQITYSKLNDNTYIFDGKILINDLYKIIDYKEEIFNDILGESETLAGLILEIKGEIPDIKEKIIYKNFEFTIISVDSRRIKKIKLEIN